MYLPQMCKKIDFYYNKLIYKCFIIKMTLYLENKYNDNDNENYNELTLYNLKDLLSFCNKPNNRICNKTKLIIKCNMIIELPIECNNLINLVTITTLKFVDCDLLIKLPDDCDNLINLNTLIIINCNSLKELSHCIDKLINLTNLEIHNCNMLSELPTTIGNLINLSYMTLCYCNLLNKLPSSIGKLKQLITLKLHSIPLLYLPEDICTLINLKNFDLSHCNMITYLPVNFGNLQNLNILYISQCNALTKLPYSFGKLINLQKLYIQNCDLLIELSTTFGDLINLTHLILSGCIVLSELPDNFGNLLKLTHLSILQCDALKVLPISIGFCNNLQQIIIYNTKISINEYISNIPVSMILCVCLHILAFNNIEQNISVLRKIWYDKIVSYNKLQYTLVYSHTEKEREQFAMTTYYTKPIINCNNRQRITWCYNKHNLCPQNMQHLITIILLALYRIQTLDTTTIEFYYNILLIEDILTKFAISNYDYININKSFFDNLHNIEQQYNNIVNNDNIVEIIL